MSEQQSTQAPSGMPGVTPGRIVHYVLPDGRSKGEHRPAVIVRTWTGHSPDMVNLQVFTDGLNDFEVDKPGSSGILWATSVHYSETKEPNTWHWIEPA
jgi:hypothetical protein